VLFQILNRIGQLEHQVLELISQADRTKQMAITANKTLEELVVANKQSAKDSAQSCAS
jgi:hypothetical protein